MFLSENDIKKIGLQFFADGGDEDKGNEENEDKGEEEKKDKKDNESNEKKDDKSEENKVDRAAMKIELLKELGFDDEEVAKAQAQKYKEEEDKKIKVGDWVEIVNWKMSYPIYSNFFSEHNLEDLGRNFRYGCYLSNGDKLRAAYIEGDRFVLSRKEKIDPYGPQDCVYLMDIRGLKKVAKPNQ